MPMTIFHCASCGVRLTADLHQIDEVPQRPARDGLPVDGVRRAPATMPRGFYAVDPDPTGTPLVPSQDQDSFIPAYPGGPSMDDEGVEMVSGGPRNTLLLHPEDMPDLSWLSTGEVNCCGSPGWPSSTGVALTAGVSPRARPGRRRRPGNLHGGAPHRAVGPAAGIIAAWPVSEPDPCAAPAAAG